LVGGNGQSGEGQTGEKKWKKGHSQRLDKVRCGFKPPQKQLVEWGWGFWEGGGEIRTEGTGGGAEAGIPPVVGWEVWKEKKQGGKKCRS